MTRSRSARARYRGTTSLSSGGGGPGGGDESNFAPTYNAIGCSFARYGGSADNGAVVTAQSATFTSAQLAPWEHATNGNYADNDGPYFFGVTISGDNTYVTFTFRDAVDLRGVRHIYGDVFTPFTFMPQRSDDAGSSWVDLAPSPLSWTTANSFFSPTVRNNDRGGENLWDNGVKSQYYRFVARSNGTSGRYCSELEFKVMAHPLSGGDRTASITFTSNRSDRNSRALSIAMNGKSVHDASNGDYNSFDQFNVNDYMQFAFNAAVRIKGMQFQSSSAVSAANRGQFVWHYSDDGSAWTVANVAAFTARTTGADATMTTPIFPGADEGSGAHTYWRFVKAVAGSDNLNAGVKDILFDLANE